MYLFYLILLAKPDTSGFASLIKVVIITCTIPNGSNLVPTTKKDLVNNTKNYSVHNTINESIHTNNIEPVNSTVSTVNPF